MGGRWAITILAASLALLPGTASAFTLFNSSLHGWDTDTLSIYVDPSACPIPANDLYSAIDSATALWNGVPSTRLKLERGATVSVAASSLSGGTPSSGIPYPAIVCSTNFIVDANLPAGADDVVAGAANIKYTNYTIDYGYLILNATAGKKANISNFSAETLSIIIAHEIGHVLGLGHSSDTTALMYYNASAKQHLSLAQDDIDGITFLYPRDEPAGGKFFGCGSMAAMGAGGGPGDGSGSAAAACELAMLLGIAACATRARRLHSGPGTGL